jgi:cytoskeletal protein CcmA (bactofilin family)
VYGPIFTTLIDSGDSSAITITPDVVMSASMTIQQDLFVDNLTTTRDLDVTGRIIASGNISGPVAVLAAVFAGNIVATGNITANNIAATTSINIAGAQVATIDDAAALAIALG